MRLSAPELLIDITPARRAFRHPGRRRPRARSARSPRTREIERSAEIAKHLPLLAQAAPHIAHAAIRNVGTIGGSLALADPAAEWPACCIALDARFALAGKARHAQGEGARVLQGTLFHGAAPGRSARRGVEIPMPGTGLSRRFRRAGPAPRRLRDRRSRGRREERARRAVGRASRVLRRRRDAVLARKAMAAIEGKPRRPTRPRRRRRSRPGPRPRPPISTRRPPPRCSSRAC